MFAGLRDEKKRQEALRLSIFFLATSSGAGLVELYRSGSRSSALGASLVTALIVFLALLSASSKRVETVINATFSWYFQFSLWALATVLPSTLFLWFSRTLVDKFPPLLQLFFLFLWTSLLAVALLLMATETNRDRLFRWLEWIGWLAPFVYCFNILLISVIFFGTVCYLLAAQGTLEFRNLQGNVLRGADLSVDKFLDFFLWHFFDAVPLFKINETLLWKLSLAYESAWVGVLVLLFKVAVIAPTITAIGSYWKRQQLQDDEEKGKQLTL